MKAKLFFIFAAVLLLFSGIANAEVIWNDNLMWWNADSFVWLKDNAAAGKTTTIDNGQLISFNSGSFASQIGEKIHAVAEIVDKNGKTTVVTSKEFTITNGGYTPYFTGTISKTHYKKVGTYYLRITLSINGEEDLIDYITLNVQEPAQPTNHNPVAQFTFTPTNPTVNQLVSFTSTSSDQDGDTLTYSWDFKDGSLSTSANPTHKFVKEGSYAVSLTVTDVLGLTDTVTHTVNVEKITTVNHAPVANFDYNPKPVYADAETTFDGTLSTDQDNDELTYQWSVEGLQNLLTKPVQKIIFNKPGTYTVSLMVNDGGLNDLISKEIEVLATQNLPPTNVDFSFVPANPSIGQTVTFTGTATDADGDALTFSWDFDGDNIYTSTGQTATYIYTQAKTYLVSMKVSDGANEVIKTKSLTVNGGQLTVDSLTCFENVVVGHEQSCSVGVKNMLNQAELGVQVKLYYHNGQYIGTCNTKLAGKCQVMYDENSIGTKTVYATAEKLNYLPDLSKKLTFTYNVVEEAYNIVDLDTFNDYGSMVSGIKPDHEFYRGEDMYVRFRVKDKITGKFLNDHDVVTNVELVSNAGGMAKLVELDSPTNTNKEWFYYELHQIPLNHEFYGESQAFAFAFDFAFQKGGQEYVDLTILNNPPQIVGLANVIKVQNFAQNVLNLEPYESDKEDNKPLGEDGMSWEVSGVSGNLFTADIVGKKLVIMPLGQKGNEQIVLRLHDLDTANGFDDHYAEQTITVSIAEEYAFTININAIPMQGEAPLKVLFGFSTVGQGFGELTAEWDYGDGVKETVVNQQAPIEHKFTLQGEYLVTLTLTDEIGNSAVDTETITVTPTQSEFGVKILVDGTDIDTLEKEVPFLAQFKSLVSGGEGSVTYSWTITNGGANALVSNEKNVNYNFNQLGIYTVTLTVTDEAGNTATDSVTVKLFSEALSVELSATTTGGGVPLTVDFLAQVTGGSGALFNYNYHWVISMGGESYSWDTQIPSFSYTFESLGDFTVTVTVTDEYGNSATSNTITIHVDTEQGVVVAIKAVPQSGHAPLEVEFTADVLSGNAPFTYSWVLGDGATSDKSSFKHIYEKEGVYEVKLTVTDGDGDMGTATITINVKDKKTPVTSRKVVEWTNLKLLGGETYAPGDMVELLVNFKNEANWDLENVKITSMIPELGVKKSAGPFDLGEGDETTKILYLQLPYDAPQGEYDIRVVINNDGDDKIHRIKHRKITIE